MATQTLNKTNIKKAIKFLSGIPEDQWVTYQQTQGFDPQYVGKYHCVLGHLGVNPASPFYDKNKIEKSYGVTLDSDTNHFALLLNRFGVKDRKIKYHLSAYNNEPHLNESQTSKEAVLKQLNSVLKMVEEEKVN